MRERGKIPVPACNRGHYLAYYFMYTKCTLAFLWASQSIVEDEVRGVRNSAVSLRRRLDKERGIVSMSLGSRVAGRHVAFSLGGSGIV